MRFHILLTIGLLLPAPSFAQDAADFSGGGESGVSPGDVELLTEVQLGSGDSVSSADFLSVQYAEAPQHPVLKGMGLSLRQITDGLIYEHFPLDLETGMVASDVLGNLPAYNAGVRWNDVIAKVNGKPISSVEEFVKAYKEAKGDEVSIEFIHKGQLKKAAVSKADVAKWEKDFKIGVHVEPISEQLAQHLGLDGKQKSGLFISGVVKDSPAEKAGLKTGDLLLAANGAPLKSTDVLHNLVRESRGRELALEYVHAGKTRNVKLSPAEQPVPKWRVHQFGTDSYPLMWSLDSGKTLNVNAWGQPVRPVADAATLERLTKAVEQLSKDVTQLKKELESKDK